MGAFGAGKTSPTFSGAFDTDAKCVAGGLLGDCAVVAQTGEDAAPELCVCRVIDAVLGDVALSGKRPLVVLADGNVKIAGTVRVLAGTRYRYTDPAYGSAGGLGGSFGTIGGGAATTAYGNETLVPLMGGMFGQAVCKDTTCKPEALGGRGGGAIQISARLSLTVAKDGLLDAGGLGGTSPGPDSGGPGGGSGGAILLESPALSVLGIVVANGGSGSGGASVSEGGSAGLAGSLGKKGAKGGEGEDDHGCILNGYTVGGDGGLGAAADTLPTAGQAGECVGCIPNACVRTGGAGGGLGRIRLRHGGASIGDGLVSPTPSVGAILDP